MVQELEQVGKITSLFLDKDQKIWAGTQDAVSNWTDRSAIRIDLRSIIRPIKSVTVHHPPVSTGNEIVTALLTGFGKTIILFLLVNVSSLTAETKHYRNNFPAQHPAASMGN